MNEKTKKTLIRMTFEFVCAAALIAAVCLFGLIFVGRNIIFYGPLVLLPAASFIVCGIVGISKNLGPKVLIVCGAAVFIAHLVIAGFSPAKLLFILLYAAAGALGYFFGILTAKLV